MFDCRAGKREKRERQIVHFASLLVGGVCLCQDFNAVDLSIVLDCCKGQRNRATAAGGEGKLLNHSFVRASGCCDNVEITVNLLTIDTHIECALSGHGPVRFSKVQAYCV